MECTKIYLRIKTVDCHGKTIVPKRDSYPATLAGVNDKTRFSKEYEQWNK